MRRVPICHAVLLAATLVAGCARTTDGRANPNPAHATKPVASADLDAVLLTPLQLTSIVGSPVELRIDQSRPVGGGPSGLCGALANGGSPDLVGDGFSSFRVLALGEGTGGQSDHVVVQAVAVYPDARTAGQQFASATTGLAPCNGRRLNDKAYWRYGVDTLTPDTVRWNKTETDVPWHWVCGAESRVRDNAILSAMSCRGDDAAGANAEAIVNQMSATVWDLSSPNGSR